MNSRLSEKRRAAFGVDVGGTRIKYGFADENGDLLFQKNIQTAELSSMTEFLHWTQKMFLLGREMLHADFHVLPSIGVGLPGSVQEGRRNVHLTNIPWEISDFPSTLEIEGESFSYVLANDGNLAALGEYVKRRNESINQMLFVGIGTGLGGGLIYNGEIFAGSTGSSCELGHIKINDERDFPCGCGAFGCLESIVSVKGISNLTRSILQEELNPEAFFLLKNKSEAHQRAYQIFIDSLAIGLRNAVVCFDPERIVIGGGVAKSTHLFLSDVQARFAAVAYAPQRHILIEESILGSRASLIGAAYLALMHRKC